MDQTLCFMINGYFVFPWRGSFSMNQAGGFPNAPTAPRNNLASSSASFFLKSSGFKTRASGD